MKYNSELSKNQYLKVNGERKFLLNIKQVGEALELLSSLESNSVSLVFLDPQYQPVRQVLPTNYPLYSQSDYQILRILEQVERVLKPSSFAFLWVNKTLLGNDRLPLWLLKTPALKIVDFLVWHKKNSLGLGNWLRSNAEYCFLIQKLPTSGKLFKNRSFGNVWEENVLPPNKKKHPHQKPRELTRALILATTEPGDLIIDPCAGSFMVLEVCQELKREFCGVDLTFKEMEKFKKMNNLAEPLKKSGLKKSREEK